MATLTSVYRILIDIDQAQRSMATLESKAAQSLQSIGRNLTTVGTAMTAGVTVPIVAAVGGVAKAAIDFESSFAGVRKTVNASEAEFDVLAEQFRELAKTIPVNVNELNRLGEAAGALGIPKEEIVDFTRVMALLGVTTDLTSDQAAESVAKIQNIFGAAGKDTERFASTLVALGNDGASTESQIVSMATRIAGAGHAVNMTQGEVLAFASALSSVGIEAEMGGSAISRVFIDIAAAVSEGGDAVAGFAKVSSMSVEQFSKMFKEDAAGAVNAFITGLGRIKESGGDLLGTLEELGFSEIRVRDTLLRTAGAGDLLTRALNLQKQAWSENSALAEEARKRFETTASQLALLWNKVKDVAITLGNALLPTIQATIGAVDSLLPLVDSAAKLFAAMPVPVQATVVGLLAVAAAIGPLLVIIGQMSIGVSGLITLFAAKGVAVRTLATAFPALTASLTGVSGAIAVSTARVGALGLALTGLASSVAIVAAAFAGWQIGTWVGENVEAAKKLQNNFAEFILTSNTGYAAALRLVLGLERIPPEMAKSAVGANAAAEAFQRLNDKAIADLSKSLEALATRDMAKWSGALEETKRKAQELAGDLPSAILRVDAMATAVSRMGTEGKLTPSVLNEIANQSRGLKAQGAELPPILQNIVDSFDRIQKSGPAAGSGIATVGTASAEAKKKLEELKNELLEIEGTLGRRWVSHGSMKGIEEVGIPTNDIEQFRAAIDLARERAAAEREMMNEIEVGRMNAAAAEMQRIADQEEAYREFYNWLGERRMQDDAAAMESAGRMAKVFQGLPELLVKSLIGGGGVSGALKAFGVQIADGLFGKGGALEGALNAAKSGLSSIFGNSIGGALAAAIPGIGAMIGPALEAVWNGIKKIFGGPSELELAGRQAARAFEDSIAQMMTAQQKAEAGGVRWKEVVISIRDSYLSTGRTAEEAMAAVERLWDAEKQGPEAVAAVQDEINAVVEEAARIAEERMAHIKAIGSQVEAEIAKLGDVAGTLPERFRGPLEELAEMGGIAKEALAGLFDENDVPWEKMQAAAEKFGISLEGLGPKFQGARLGADAKEILEAFELLTKSGADVGAVLLGMSDEISKLVQESIKFGTSIPENMRPLIENLMASGKLLDENGQKIENINGLKFGDPIVVGLDAIIQRLDALLKGLGIDLPAAAQAGAAAAGAAAEQTSSAYDAAATATADAAARAYTEWEQAGRGIGKAAAEIAVDMEKSAKDSEQKWMEFLGDIGLAVDGTADDIAKFMGGAADRSELEWRMMLFELVQKFKAAGFDSEMAIRLAIEHMGAHLKSLPGVASDAASGITASLRGIQLPTLRVPVTFDVENLSVKLPSFHSGGLIGGIPVAHDGLAVDERLIIAQTGEGILSRNAMRRIGGKAGLDAMNRGDFGARQITIAPQFTINGATTEELKEFIRHEAPRETARAIRLGLLPEWYGL